VDVGLATFYYLFASPATGAVAGTTFKPLWVVREGLFDHATRRAPEPVARESVWGGAGGRERGGVEISRRDGCQRVARCPLLSLDSQAEMFAVHCSLFAPSPPILSRDCGRGPGAESVGASRGRSAAKLKTPSIHWCFFCVAERAMPPPSPGSVGRDRGGRLSHTRFTQGRGRGEAILVG
jgi:hypothetical protein